MTISDINISPKKISRKKFFLIFKFASLPYPEVDNARKINTYNKYKYLKKNHN